MWLTAVRSPNRLVMPRTSMASRHRFMSSAAYFATRFSPPGPLEFHVDRLPGVQLRARSSGSNDRPRS